MILQKFWAKNIHLYNCTLVPDVRRIVWVQPERVIPSDRARWDPQFHSVRLSVEVEKTHLRIRCLRGDVYDGNFKVTKTNRGDEGKKYTGENCFYRALGYLQQFQLGSFGLVLYICFCVFEYLCICILLFVYLLKLFQSDAWQPAAISIGFIWSFGLQTLRLGLINCYNPKLNFSSIGFNRCF